MSLDLWGYGVPGPGERTAMPAIDDDGDYDELYHFTDDPHFSGPHPDHEPATISEFGEPGIYLTNDPHNSSVSGGGRPYMATFRVPSWYEDHPGFEPDHYGNSSDYFVRPEWFHELKLTGVSPTPVDHHTAARTAMPKLYRGLDREFDPGHEDIPIGAPRGYSHWTDNPGIARQYAGPDGHVYQYDLPDEAMGSKWLDENADGKTPLYFDNGEMIGHPGMRPKLKGREYVVYNEHPDYDPTQIKPYKESRIMTAAVTVYSQPNCVQCDMTKKQLERLGVEHDTVDVSADPEAHAYVKSLGYSSAPVVVAGDQHWCGFRPDRLKELVGE